MSTTENSFNEEFLYSETKRHKPCLIYQGYRYVQDKIQNRTVYWRCEDRTNCNGRAHQTLIDGSYPILTIQHNHPPLLDDLSRHDIVVVDSHRRRRRETQSHLMMNKDKCTPSTNHIETRPIPSDMMQTAKYSIAVPPPMAFGALPPPPQPPPTASASSHSHSQSIDPRFQRYPTIEPNRMFYNMNKTSKIASKTPIKSSSSPSSSFVNDLPSRLNQFSWEEIEGRYVPVIFRNENSAYQRYTSKMYVEHTLFQSSSWQPYIILARSLPPLVSCSYTEPEFKLFRSIVEWHLAGVQFKTIPPTDCLIRFEELLTFYHTLKQLRDNMSIPSGKTLPIKPSPIRKPSTGVNIPPISAPAPPPPPPPIPAVVEPETRQSGWIQINNVFLPYIVKTSKSNFEYNLRDREFYIPYEILLKCQIFGDHEFSWKNSLIKATQEDFDLLNHLITDINIFDEKVPEKTLMINLYHLMIGFDRIFYIKFLPHKQPRSQVNKYHSEVLKLQGGVLVIQGHPLIPYVIQNNRFYVPLYYTCQVLPYLLGQARRAARAPRQFEIDYLNVVCLYFTIEISPFTSDTLLVDIFSIKSSNLPTGIHFRTLQEHQQNEKKKFLQGNTKVNKTPVGSTNHKTTKFAAGGQVMINPLIHHPSFYGLSSSAQVPVQTTRVVEPETNNSSRLARPSIEMRPMIFHQRTLNVLIHSSNHSIPQGKVSLREILKKFAFDIDYEKFFQWCQSNALMPLLTLDEQEKKIVPTNDAGSVFIDQCHLDRCLDLLNDLKRGLISMTLLPSSDRSTITGAKKRKSTLTSSRTDTTSTDVVQTEPIVTDQSTEKLDQNDTDDVVVTMEDDDKMPVVASVEEEQTLNESDNQLFIVESTDGNDEKIHFDEIKSSAKSEPIDQITEQENDSSVEQNNESVLSTSTKKIRIRSRSSRTRRTKRNKTMVDEDEKPLSTALMMKLITEEHIDRYLRTLFTLNNDKISTRTPLADDSKYSASSTNSTVFDIFTSINVNETCSISSNISDSSSSAVMMTMAEQKNKT